MSNCRNQVHKFEQEIWRENDENKHATASSGKHTYTTHTADMFYSESKQNKMWEKNISEKMKTWMRDRRIGIVSGNKIKTKNIIIIIVIYL